jgi:acid-sensing ion channel, other
MPSCNEVDILMIHETRDNIYSGAVDPFSVIEVTLANLPTERYKRNVVRGKLDLVGEPNRFLIASI